MTNRNNHTKKKRNVVLTPELSETKRRAAAARWGNTDRTPYKTIRLSERAVKLIREDAARRGISASQAVEYAIMNSELTDYQCQNYKELKRKRATP